MRHGGKRRGAGRKKGSLSVRTQEIAAAASKGGITPLEFMLGVLRDNSRPFEDRFKAAVQAAPFVHPRLASTEMKLDDKRSVREYSTEELEAILAEDRDGASGEEEGASESGPLH